MKYRMTGSICRKTCPGLGVPTKTTLCDLPIRCTTEHTTEMFQFVYHSRGGLDIFLRRILVIKKITSRPTSVASLFELSPMPVEDYDSEKIIDYLFPENPLICCGVSSRTFATRHREDWRGKLEKMQLIVPNPMSSKYGKTQTGKESMHTMENTGARTYLIVEFDEGSHDDHAALLCPEHLDQVLRPHHLRPRPHRYPSMTSPPLMKAQPMRRLRSVSRPLRLATSWCLSRLQTVPRPRVLITPRPVAP